MLKTLLNSYLLVLGLFLVPFLSYTQESKELKTLLSELELRYEIKFSYADADLEGIEVTIDEGAPLNAQLSSIRQQTQLQIKKLNDRYYTIQKTDTISICGQVLDNYAENNVPGATIEILGTERALVTDLNGNFNVDNVERSASIRIRYLGYMPKIIPVASLIGSNECPKILLAERREVLNEVVVYQFLASGIQRETDASISLNLDELGILPGLIEPDVLQSVQALPGIKSIDETVSDINVRGGTNDQNLILWNGIKIYQSGHFFGLISAFNPYLIKRVSIYKNGTPSRYGDGVSSVISMDTNDEIEGIATGGGGFNLLTGDVFGQFPIKDDLEFQFSARRSLTDFLNTPTYNSFTQRVFQDSEVNGENQTVDQEFDRDEDFYFFDFSGKVLYDINTDQKLRLSFIVMDNDLDYVETNRDTDETTQSFLDQTNVSVGLQWFNQWSERFYTNANIYFSNYNLDAIGISENQSQQLFQNNKVDERAVKVHSDYLLSDALKWSNGFQYIETGITNISDVTQPPFQSNITAVIRNYAPYTQLGYNSFEDRFIATVGLRANYLINLATKGATFNELLLEPRLNINFRVAKNLRAQLLGELKSQTTNQIIDLEQNFLGIEKRRWILSDELLLPITKSKQGSLGFNYDNNGFYLGLEGFYKKVDGISTFTQGFQNENQFSGEIGRYDVKGVEFLMNKKGANYSAWASYTFNKNDYTFPELNPTKFPNNLDVRHAVTLASTFSIKKLKLGLGLNYRTGKPYTEPEEQNPLNTLIFPNQINYKSPNSSRLPEYIRADFSATYNFFLSSRVKGNIGVSVLNLTDRKNTLNRYYRVSENNEIETVENNSLGLTPNFSFRVNF